MNPSTLLACYATGAIAIGGGILTIDDGPTWDGQTWIQFALLVGLWPIALPVALVVRAAGAIREWRETR